MSCGKTLPAGVSSEGKEFQTCYHPIYLHPLPFDKTFDLVKSFCLPHLPAAHVSTVGWHHILDHNPLLSVPVANDAWIHAFYGISHGFGFQVLSIASLSTCQLYLHWLLSILHELLSISNHHDHFSIHHHKMIEYSFCKSFGCSLLYLCTTQCY